MEKKLTQEQRAALAERIRAAGRAIIEIADRFEAGEPVPNGFGDVVGGERGGPAFVVTNPIHDIESVLLGYVEGYKAIASEAGVSVRTLHRLLETPGEYFPARHCGVLGTYAWVAEVRRWRADREQVKRLIRAGKIWRPDEMSVTAKKRLASLGITPPSSRKKSRT